MSELIDRNALIEKLDGIWDCNDMVFEPDDCCDIISDCKSCKWRETKEAIKRIVLNMKAIDAEPVVHAENITPFNEVDQFACSKCGIILEGYARKEIEGNGDDETYYEYVMRYCPNCGARMDGEGGKHEADDHI